MKPYQRHNARVYALQGLYEWLLSGNSAEAIIQHLTTEYDFSKTDTEYFKKVLKGVITHQVELDQYMQPYLDRPQNELTPVELSVLRLAIYELKDCLDVPYRVVINEALELTKKFGASDGFKFVNGILDHVAKDLRSIEISNASK